VRQAREGVDKGLLCAKAGLIPASDTRLVAYKGAPPPRVEWPQDVPVYTQRDAARGKAPCAGRSTDPGLRAYGKGPVPGARGGWWPASGLPEETRAGRVSHDVMARHRSKDLGCIRTGDST